MPQVYVTVRCLSVCLSHLSTAATAGLLLGAPPTGDINCPVIRPPHIAAARLLLWARRSGDINRQRRPPGAQQKMRALSRFQPP